MSNLVFADSSGLIAKALEGDPQHRIADHEIRRILRQGQRFMTSNYVFDETVTRVQRLTSHSRAAQVGDWILSSRVIQRIYIDEELESASWKLFLKYNDQNLSFTDASTIVIMKRFEIDEIFTFDSDFERVGHSRIPHAS